MIELLFQHIHKAYGQLDLQELALADEVEDQIDEITELMTENHIRRLSQGICSANAGAQYLELASDAERAADHLINVGAAVRKII